mmetsp:Transcript_96226/g.258741  ORF Transcript_96226/g.258741 Transcript_96226/m.258741 type:complete len:262 (+) Transcript_96226:226-1011(+)
MPKPRRPSFVRQPSTPPSWQPGPGSSDRSIFMNRSPLPVTISLSRNLAFGASACINRATPLWISSARAGSARFDQKRSKSLRLSSVLSSGSRSRGGRRGAEAPTRGLPAAPPASSPTPSHAAPTWAQQKSRPIPMKSNSTMCAAPHRSHTATYASSTCPAGAALSPPLPEDGCVPVPTSSTRAASGSQTRPRAAQQNRSPRLPGSASNAYVVAQRTHLATYSHSDPSGNVAVCSASPPSREALSSETEKWSTSAPAWHIAC